MPDLFEKRLSAAATRYNAFVKSLPEPLRGQAKSLTKALAPGANSLVEFYGAVEGYPLLRFPIWLEEKYIKDGCLSEENDYGVEAVCASLYGYLYIRIQDNVIDEPELFNKDFLLLGNELVREFFFTYQWLFDPGSPFWDYMRRYWLTTTNNTLWERIECGGKLRAFGDEDLAKVGGKLEGGKISMAALCILAGREEDIARYGPVMDRLNIASQLHNDAVSFVKDLKHDYFTCIIAHTVGSAETSLEPSEIFCKASLKALTGSYLEDWLGLAEDYNSKALALLEPGELPGLAQYVKAKNAHLSKLKKDIAEIKKELLSI